MKMIMLTSVDSTNAYCLREAGDLDHFTVVSAEVQTAGRGRRGRSWHSPEGRNIYCSILMKPPFPAANVRLFGQLAVLGVFDVLVESGLNDSWINWPNDVFVGKRKIAGVLCENHMIANRIAASVVGIGVNLNMTAAEAEQIDQPATSVFMETGTAVDRDAFLIAVCKRFGELCLAADTQALDGLLERWRQASRLPGRDVRITEDGEVKTGRVTGLEPDGRITVELENGDTVFYRDADVSLELI